MDIFINPHNKVKVVSINSSGLSSSLASIFIYYANSKIEKSSFSFWWKKSLFFITSIKVLLRICVIVETNRFLFSSSYSCWVIASAHIYRAILHRESSLVCSATCKSSGNSIDASLFLFLLLSFPSPFVSLGMKGSSRGDWTRMLPLSIPDLTGIDVWIESSTAAPILVETSAVCVEMQGSCPC